MEFQEFEVLPKDEIGQMMYLKELLFSTNRYMQETH
jgi:hypothetical protein